MGGESCLLLGMQPLRGQFAKVTGLDLVAACQGEVVIAEEKHVTRRLVSAYPFSQEFPDFLGAGARAVVRDDAGDDDLAERSVRQPDRLGYLHSGMFGKGLIDFER